MRLISFKQVILAAQICLPASGHFDSQSCIDLIQRTLLDTRVAASLSLSRPGVTRVRGIVSHLVTGELAFAITPYLLGPGHRAAELAIAMKRPSDPPILGNWGGELEFHNGVLFRANMTSKYLWESGMKNDPELLAKYLASSVNRLPISEKFEILPYDPASRHLDPRLNRILAMTGAKPDQSFMHQIANNLTPVSNYLKAIENSSGEEDHSIDLQRRTLGEISRQSWVIFQTYAQLLREDGALLPHFEALPPILSKLLQNRILTEEERQILRTHSDELKTLASLSGSGNDFVWDDTYLGLVREFPALPLSDPER